MEPSTIQPASQKFPKSERLSSRKLIGELFRKGSVRNFATIRFHYLAAPQGTTGTHQVLFSVPVKLIRKATERNHIKRLLRECYRKNKSILISGHPVTLPYLLAYVYISRSLPVFAELEKQVVASLEYLLTKENHST